MIKTPEKQQVKKSGVYERPERVIKAPEEKQAVKSGATDLPGRRIRLQKARKTHVDLVIIYKKNIKTMKKI